MAYHLCAVLNTQEEIVEMVEEWETSDPVKLDALNAAVNASNTQENVTTTVTRAREFEKFLRTSE